MIPRTWFRTKASGQMHQELTLGGIDSTDMVQKVPLQQVWKQGWGVARGWGKGSNAARGGASTCTAEWDLGAGAKSSGGGNCSAARGRAPFGGEPGGRWDCTAARGGHRVGDPGSTVDFGRGWYAAAGVGPGKADGGATGAMGGTGAALVLLRFHVPMEEGGTGAEEKGRWSIGRRKDGTPDPRTDGKIVQTEMGVVAC
jgi:hypothetical protein